MQPTELVQCIECESDDYFTWMSLPSSSVSCPLVQMARSMLPEVGLLIGLLRKLASESFLLGFSSMSWVRI